MNDQLDRALADSLRRDAARVPGRGPGFSDVRRRVRQRRQRQVVLGTAPAVLGAAWLVTRPTPASIGVGAGGAVETGDAASTVTGAGTRIECRDADGNLVLADVSWVDGVATIEVSGSTLPRWPSTTSFGQEITAPPPGIIHCDMIDAVDVLTATTISWVGEPGSTFVCIGTSSSVVEPTVPYLGSCASSTVTIDGGGTTTTGVEVGLPPTPTPGLPPTSTLGLPPTSTLSLPTTSTLQAP